ncbi:energy transducer TonB family protein [Sphingomonas sp. 22176]|uniref:energy transducer TonB family protein n=1 Tax=Sphingomonas sp. 22176 TaxID=3453884 RepID=UPI003F8580D4
MIEEAEADRVGQPVGSDHLHRGSHIRAAFGGAAGRNHQVGPRTNSASTAQVALANWQSELLGHLKRFLRYPRPSQSAREEGIAKVTITVDRQGQVLGARLARGSGYPMLDGEAVAMMRRGSPVPPPGADIPGDPVIVTIPILFSLRR